MKAVAVQIYHASRILVLSQRPSLGGFGETAKRQSAIDKHVEAIGGIACMLEDYASQTMSSQCLFIGQFIPSVFDIN